MPEVEALKIAIRNLAKPKTQQICSGYLAEEQVFRRLTEAGVWVIRCTPNLRRLGSRAVLTFVLQHQRPALWTAC